MIEFSKEYKESTTGKIPIDWEEILVEDLVESGTLEKPLDGNHGNIHPTASDFVKEGIPFIMANNVQNGVLDLTNCYFIKKEQADKLQKGFSKTGDVLLTHKGTVGNTAIVGNIMTDYIMLTPQVTYYRIKNENKLNRYYLKSFFESEIFQGILKVRSGGGTRAYIGITNQRKLPILIPQIQEQKAIAHILGLMDTAINKNNQLITQNELCKKWLMQNLLTGKKRLKGFYEEWKETSLSKLFDRVTRKNTEVNTNVVTISAQRGFIKQTDFFNKLIASEILDNYFLVHKGEFCYNKSYSNGYPWGATKRLNYYDKAVVTTLYICFGVKDQTNTDGDFFEQFFEANLLDNGLTKIAHEGGRAHGLLNVTPSDFFSLKVTIPNKEEQTAIAQVLQATDKEMQLLKTKTEKLREQKKGMMQVLLTGKKRLKIK